MFDFGQCLKTLRLENNITQKKLAKKIGVSERGIQNYELNLRKPNFEVIIKLSEFFNVSSDYLLGLSDEYSSDNKKYNFMIEGNSEKYLLKLLFEDLLNSKINKEDLITLLKYFSKLNKKGRSEILEFIKELNNVDRYLKKEYKKNN